jgi:hypothetical protein
MIKSKLRPVVVPQLEHARLSGTLASLWGNPDFDPPAIDRQSFIAGVSLHDRGYGPLDPFDLFDIPEATWLEITRRGFYAPCSDPVADLITKLHLKRLVGAHAFAAEMDQVIQAQFREHGFSAEQFERIDRITDFCDRIALKFCLEQSTTGAVTVFPKNSSAEEIKVCFTLNNGTIAVEPWPFSVEGYSTFLIGYARAGYPETLDPVILPVELVQAPDSGAGA